VHVHPPLLLAGQLEPAVKLVGLAVKVGCVPQPHGTGTAFSPATAKVRIALAGQVVLGTAIVTCAGWAGEMVPLDGVKVMPFMPVLALDQASSPSAPLASLSVSVHVQPAPGL
jgi:hypothetical protein